MTMTSIATFILTLAVYLSSNLLWYRDGKRHGASDVIHQLFAGESDFYRYQIYRMTGGRDAWMLNRLLLCLRNDYGMVIDWDATNEAWVIEVDRDEVPEEGRDQGQRHPGGAGHHQEGEQE